MWAGGEHLTPSEPAGALLGADVVRAVELDINPEWVAEYLYGHRGGVGPLAPVPVVPGQTACPASSSPPTAVTSSRSQRDERSRLRSMATGVSAFSLRFHWFLILSVETLPDSDGCT